MSGGRRWPALLAWTALLAVGALAALLRYQLIEPPAFAERCAAAADAPALCALREVIVAGFLSNAFGYMALAAAALALLRQRLWTASLAAALGAFALELYCYQSGALALLVGAVLLVRGAPRRQQHGNAEQQVQAQP